MLRVPTLTLLFLLALAAPASAQWRAVADIDLGPTARAQALAVGDFDSDGRQDLAVADYAGNRVPLRYGNGDGTFRGEDKLLGPVRPEALTIADFDADGDEDLGVASAGRMGFAYDVGVKPPIVTSSYEVGTPHSLAVGDFNGDSRTDVVVAVDARVAGQLGGGGPNSAIDVPLGGPARAVATGDFDGNATEDVAALVNGTSPRLVVLPGRNDGGFETGKTLTLPNAGSDLAIADLDADGREDAVVTVPGRNRVIVRLGNGDGTLRTGLPDLTVGAQPEAIAVGDVDADGRLDLVTANAGAGTVSVLLGTGDGRFLPPEDLAAGPAPVDVVIGDFNGDGREDLAVANGGAGTVSVRLGAGPPRLAGNLLLNGGFEQGLAARLPQESPTIPGWTTTAGMTFVRYGASPHFGFPTWLDAPRHGGGHNFLWGGDSLGFGGVTDASQTISVTGDAAAIDAGRAAATLSAYLGGALHYPDAITATAEFLDAGGAALGVLTVGPVTSDDRRNVTTLQRRAGSAAVPPRTRRVRVTLTSRDNDRWSSAIADNVKLTLATVPPAPPSSSPPPAGRRSFGAKTRVTIKLAARRLPLRVRILNRNDFAVTGRLRGKRFAVAAGGRTTVRLPKPKRLRGLRLTAVVKDPAGTRRTISRRVTVRRP